ncbi:MAG: branched-chain amino acid transaminase [Streptosporangiales bacterium]|nr:branched-chain amino acid transaminase [Streptosporangiales bacterium]
MTQTVDTAQGVAKGSPFGAPFDWVYVDDDFVRADDARVSVHASTLSYGTGTLEGIRACWNDDHQQLYLFEAEAHYRRLHDSARILGLELRPSVDELVETSAELLRRNDARCDTYLRPLLFLSGEVLPVRMHDIATRLSIAATPVAGDYANPAGVRCAVSSWRRTPDAVMPNRAKLIGGYVGPALAKTEAARAGYDEAILLTVDGYVAEGTTSNIFVRRGDTWLTPPATDDILEGITRRQVLQLLADARKPATQRRIHRSELYVADEILLCGTASLVVPVVEVDGRQVGDGRPGDDTLDLRRQLVEAARRDSFGHPEWTTPVY